MFSVQGCLVALSVVFLISRVIRFYSSKARTGNLPGLRSLATPLTPFGAVFPTCSINPGLSWQWKWRDHVYKNAGSETISVLGLFGPPGIYTSSPEVVRQIVSTRGQIEKPVLAGAVVRQWGPNVFTEAADSWRKHRRITAPAFVPKTYASVFMETSRLYDEMMKAEGWDCKDSVDILSTHDVTTKLALIVISRCGFGSNIPWDYGQYGTSANNSDQHSERSMSLAEALTLVSATSMERLVVPKWMYRLPIQKLRQMDKAYNIVGKFMQELISSRRAELSAGTTGEYRDVFRLILEASEQEGKYAFTDEELRGNTFIMLFAGHDTTSYTLDATLALLALHPEIQDEVHEQITSVLATAELSFDALQKMGKVQACFLEAARLFPAAYIMLRETVQDVILTHVGPKSVPEETLALEKDYNPRVFPDPTAFKPERWYGAHENDMTMFSTGSRACIGRRFALTEGVTFLARLLKDWKIEPILKIGETSEQWKARVVDGSTRMTLGIGNVPVRLRRR